VKGPANDTELYIKSSAAASFPSELCAGG
jgi:hypothetical protein